MARMLDTELLAQLEAGWRRAGALYVDAMLPGLSDEEIDRTTARLDLALPEEARRWYRWHNGSDGHGINAHRIMTTLDDDVEATVDLQEADLDWKAGWLHVMNETPFVIFDCRGGHDAPVPVWHYFQGFDFPTRPMFDSIGDMVAFWIQLMEEDHTIWSREFGWHLREPAPEDVIFRLGGVPTD
jgi:hypothetical protein